MALYNTRLKSEHTDTEELNKAKKMVYKYKTGLAARVKMYIFYQARSHICREKNATNGLREVSCFVLVPEQLIERYVIGAIALTVYMEHIICTSSLVLQLRRSFYMRACTSL